MTTLTMTTFVACKKTNDYCENISKMSNRDVLHGIRVKNGRDIFSSMKYEDLVKYFSYTSILCKIEGISSKYWNPQRFHKNKAYKSMVARHLRYHLRGLSEEQTLYKFTYELGERLGYVSRYRNGC